MLFLASPPRTAFFVLLFFPEAYKAVGRALEWDVLGVAEDETAMAQYREELGTLADRRWEALTFLMPEKEVSFLCYEFPGTWARGLDHISYGRGREQCCPDRFLLVGCQRRRGGPVEAAQSAQSISCLSTPRVESDAMRNVLEAAPVLREAGRRQCQRGGCSAQQRSPLEARGGPGP